jgi:hypothetical protein
MTMQFSNCRLSCNNNSMHEVRSLHIQMLRNFSLRMDTFYLSLSKRSSWYASREGEYFSPYRRGHMLALKVERGGRVG